MRELKQLVCCVAWVIAVLSGVTANAATLYVSQWYPGTISTVTPDGDECQYFKSNLMPSCIPLASIATSWPRIVWVLYLVGFFSPALVISTR